MSRKTSTAALALFRLKSLCKLCRVPRHPAGAREGSHNRSNDSPREFNGIPSLPAHAGGARNPSSTGAPTEESSRFNKPSSRFARRML